MPNIKYQDISFSDWKLAIVKQVNALVTQYKARGYNLTLRQLYYQFVSRDWLPERWADPATGSTNNQRSYKNLGSIINDGRLAGLIDWTSVEDRTRELSRNAHWESTSHILEAVAQQYAIDKWKGSTFQPEVWVEKDALEDVVGRACRSLDVPFFSCRGYTSQTAMWEAGQRFLQHAREGQTPVIIHLGDHDPSGIDMSRDIEERIRMFMGTYGSTLRFTRIALNADQIKKYNPPPNPAKVTDSRCKGYMAVHGDDSWELDALDPSVIDGLVHNAIEPLRNNKIWKKWKDQEDTEKMMLAACAGNWDAVKQFLEDNDLSR